MIYRAILFYHDIKPIDLKIGDEIKNQKLHFRSFSSYYCKSINLAVEEAQMLIDFKKIKDINHNVFIIFIIGAIYSPVQNNIYCSEETIAYIKEIYDENRIQKLISLI